MAPAQDKLHAALRAVAAGDFAALTPEQVAELERALNENPPVAALVADAVPKPDASLAAGLAAIDQAALPSDAAWDQVWAQVDAASARAARWTRKSGATRVLRLWRPLLAAAACLVLVAVWRMQLRSGPSADEAWPVQLATNVEIDALDVGDDATPYIVNTDGVDMIWVLQGET